MNKNKKGFTLVELVIVVAVMAILVAVAIPTVSSIVGSATDAVEETNCRTIESMIKLEEAEQSNKGVTALSAAIIQAALADANLGIEDGDFYYDATTGVCKTGTSTTAKHFNITFGSTETSATEGILVSQVSGS